MRKRDRYRFLLFVGIAIALPHSRVAAQGTFTYSANVDTVKRDGFYEIVLTPELVAKCRADMGDLRIWGPDKRFVSYATKDSQEARMPTAAMAITEAQMVQKDSSDRHSYLTVTFPEAYSIDWVGFAIRNPAFFKRSLQILAEGTHPGEWAAISDANLDPERQLFRIPTVKTRRLRIVVANADNAPLEVSNITCYQTSRYLVAWLRAGKAYRLYAGNAQATVPDYDLKYFTDSLKATPQILSVHSLQRIDVRDQPVVQTPAAPAGEVTAAGKDHSGILLWSCLSVVLLFLIYFSVRMVKAIAKKDAHDRI
ncbi:MAG TPA: hypothetical protein VGS79_22900 [Puia sp.]|nr:hypothetical protein [Puia sp.]